MKSPRSYRFKTAAAAGAGIAVFLFIDSLFAYQYVTNRIARDQGMLLAVEEAASLEHRLLRENIDTVDRLRLALDAAREDRSDEIALLGVVSADADIVASSSAIEALALPPAERIRALMERKERYSTIQNTSGGEILMALVPMKQPFQRQAAPAGRAGSFIEVGVYLPIIKGILHPLRRNLLVSTVAAILLLVSMIIFFFSLPAYLRGRTLENQVQLARSVQRRLLPDSAGADIEFAGECIPAHDVGGDFYDVFRTHGGETVLVLADVSGKGLPAALRMGVIHGAVRALSLGENGLSVAQRAALLNEMLRERTSRDFVTLFWAFYNPKRHDLRYVNAGHLPPLLVAPMSGVLRRLETGGPVLGLLPKASYEEERIMLDGAETLISFSDGLLEATNPSGEEFGEPGLLPTVRASIGQSSSEILRRIIEVATRFTDGAEFHDDLTVLIARLSSPKEPTRSDES